MTEEWQQVDRKTGREKATQAERESDLSCGSQVVVVAVLVSVVVAV